MTLFLLILCSMVTFNLIETAKILAVFAVSSISHAVVFRHLTEELIKRHEVVVITTDPAYPEGNAPENLTEIDIHDVSYKIWQETFMLANKGDSNDYIAQVETVSNTLAFLFENQLQNTKIKTLINDRRNKFDLVILEAVMKPLLIFSEIFKAPVILASSFGAPFGGYDMIGAADHPLLYPSVLRQRIHNLSILEKLKELYNHYFLVQAHRKSDIFANKMLKRLFGSRTLTIKELEKNVDMLFLNVNPIFEGIRPVPPSVVYMGGIHQNPIKELPEDLKLYLDSSINGVIYFSLGTNVDTSRLPDEKVKAVVKVFCELPQNVVVKWHTEDLPGKCSNIMISRWLPQSDLLGHANVKLFLTPAGLQLTDESIQAGVPLIGIPMLADQWYNAEKYLYHNIGLKLDFENLNEVILKNAIKSVIDNKTKVESKSNQKVNSANFTILALF